MIVVTHQQQHEHLISGEDEIILTGPPSALRGPIILQNSTDEHVFVRNLPITNANKAAEAFAVHATLKPKEVRSQNVYYSMDPHTPAGTYEMEMQVGNQNKKVKMIVQEHLDVQLSPLSIVLSGTDPGEVHTREILLSNNGNIAVTIPTIKHNTLTDMDLICRNLSQAIRYKGDEGIEKTLDEFTRSVKKDLGDWVDISIKEAGQAVQPGETFLLHLSITIPKDVNSNTNYHYTGEIRMFDKFIRYTIMSKTPGDEKNNLLT